MTAAGDAYVSVGELLLVTGLAVPTPAEMYTSVGLSHAYELAFQASVEAARPATRLYAQWGRRSSDANSQEAVAARVCEHLLAVSRKPQLGHYFAGAFLPRVDELVECSTQPPQPSGMVVCTLSPDGRKRLASEAAAGLPTLSLQSLLLEGTQALVKGVRHPPAALRDRHRCPQAWLQAGCPWMYQPPSEDGTVDVWMGEPSGAKR